jgi:hypothetical protein
MLILFLGSFEKLWKSTVSFVMSVRLSVYLQGTIDSHCTGFHEILYLSIFRESVANIQVSLKLDKKNGKFT